MPTYEFHCPACTSHFEERRTFTRSDDPAICPTCGDNHAAKVITSVQFYSPGSAAKSLLDPASRQKGTAPIAHASGCPCCSPRKPLKADTQA